MNFIKRTTTATFANVGDVINYEFDVANTGNVTMTAISITDNQVPSVTCPQTSLIPSETMVCSASYTVTQADVDAGSVTNNASASGTPPSGSPVTELSSVTVDSNAVPSIAFEKRAISSNFSMVGDILSYEFDVENTGPVTLSNIVISDNLILSLIHI